MAWRRRWLRTQNLRRRLRPFLTGDWRTVTLHFVAGPPSRSTAPRTRSGTAPAANSSRGTSVDGSSTSVSHRGLRGDRRVSACRLELTHPLQVRGFHSAVARLPLIVGRIRELVLTAQLLNRHPGIGFFENRNDLRFGESLLSHLNLLAGPCEKALPIVCRSIREAYGCIRPLRTGKGPHRADLRPDALAEHAECRRFSMADP